MATPLIVVCAGGTGREVFPLLKDLDPDQRTWKPLGFLDDHPERCAAKLTGATVLGGLSDASRYPDAKFLVACNIPKHPRSELVDRLEFPDDRYATLAHPSASLLESAQVGAGSLILQFCAVSVGVHLGRHVILQQGVIIGHDAVVQDYATCAPGAVLSGGVHVGRGAYIGSGAIVRENLHIGERAIIGMGAVVVRDVPAGAVVVGNPARPLRRDVGA